MTTVEPGAREVLTVRVCGEAQGAGFLGHEAGGDHDVGV